MDSRDGKVFVLFQVVSLSQGGSVVIAHAYILVLPEKGRGVNWWVSRSVFVRFSHVDSLLNGKSPIV